MQGVAWRELGERLVPGTVSGGQFRHPNSTLSDYRMTYPKLDEIERQHRSDDSRLRAVIECWLEGEGLDTEPSWRALIWRLDCANETIAVADSIRYLAEPLPGKSCDSITFLYIV